MNLLQNTYFDHEPYSYRADIADALKSYIVTEWNLGITMACYFKHLMDDLFLFSLKFQNLGNETDIKIVITCKRKYLLWMLMQNFRIEHFITYNGGERIWYLSKTVIQPTLWKWCMSTLWCILYHFRLNVS